MEICIFLEENIRIRMPADYDGLVHGCTEAPADFLSLAVLLQEDTDGQDLNLLTEEAGRTGFFCRIYPFD